MCLCWWEQVGTRQDGRLQMRHMVSNVCMAKGYTVISLARSNDCPTNVHCSSYTRQSPSAMLKYNYSTLAHTAYEWCHQNSMHYEVYARRAPSQCDGV
jgi:hypothetical protein